MGDPLNPLPHVLHLAERWDTCYRPYYYASMDCPICKLEEKNVKAKAVGDDFEINCSRCGMFMISSSAESMAAARPPDFRLSAWIREQSEIALSPTISSATLNSLSHALPNYRVSEKQLLLLRALERKTNFAGEKVALLTEFDLPLAWCSTQRELEYVIRALMGRNYIQLERYSDPNEAFILELVITPSGWSFLDESAKPSAFTNQVFVAMSFEPELLPAWQVGIAPAIKRAKFEPYRVDAKPHIDRIDNKIISEIKNSRFMVADVTFQRPGVYYEAGFAAGLGLPVFWSVRHDDLKHVHFDTRQYNHIVWKTAEDLEEQLYLFISVVVGKGSAT